jgi:hypothetical protein
MMADKLAWFRLGTKRQTPISPRIGGLRLAAGFQHVKQVINSNQEN